MRVGSAYPLDSLRNKSFLARKPLTRARLTPEGRKAFALYLDAMGRLVVSASRGQTPEG